MSLSGALPRTLQSITATKAFELSKRQTQFESRKNAIYAKAAKQATPRDRVKVLLDGLTQLSNGDPSSVNEDDSNSDDPKVDSEDISDSSSDSDVWGDGCDFQTMGFCRNVRRFLLQSKYDASIDSDMISQWEKCIREQIELLGVKQEHGIFFNRLVTEWLSDPAALPLAETETASESGNSFEQVGRAEMYEQRQEWEKLIFELRKTDPAAIEEYLNKLFSQTKESQDALKTLRKQIKYFGKFHNATFDVQTLNWIIPGVIRKDILSAEKVDILKGLAANDVVAQEVADVLNMRLAELESWNWSSDVLQVEMKRHLNGKYRVYMDEDILDALFVHYIGIKWAVHFKRRFKEIFDSQAWRPNSRKIPLVDQERREYFLRNVGSQHPTSISTTRHKQFRNDFFMCQLPDIEKEDLPGYDDDCEGDHNQRRGFVWLKNRLLHMVMAEAHLSTSLHGEFTAVQSDFQWFGASLPHSTLLTILKFFGVSDAWLGFFRRFLETPLRFVHDGADGPIRVRRNGVPLSHSISDWLGETMLFCLDFAVNQYAEGTYLYRIHDDFWFWGREENCTQAWATVTEFTAVMGLELNYQKTGTARLVGEKHEQASKDSSGPKQSQSGRASVSLPEGDIKWGFLQLDPIKRQFVVDEKQVDVHIAELKLQLDACQSIFGWVRAWNAYLDRFFGNNLGKPALCFGRQHVDMIISTFKRIEHELFAQSSKHATSANVTGYLGRIIEDRFGVRDLPDGFFYFPVELGGLGLRNPFVPFLAMRESMTHSPKRIINDAFVAEEKAYRAAKEKFETDGPNNKSRRFVTGTSAYSPLGVDNAPNSFMTMDEYLKYPELTSGNFFTSYEWLLWEPEENLIDRTPAVQSALARLRASSWQSLSSDRSYLTPYWQWVTELYHSDMLAKYGELAAAEDRGLPLGVIKILQEGKVRWQG